MRAIRSKGFIVAIEEGCDFYFTSDVDNFLVPDTLERLVETGLPVLAPMLRYAGSPQEEFGPFPNNWTYSNFDVWVDDTGDTHNFNGEFSQLYYEILTRTITGLFEVSLVHCTYLIRRDVFDRVNYYNGHPEGCEYIVFGYNLRVNQIPQVIDNRQVYGCITSLEENIDYCRVVLEELKKL
jgi:hypothetical protein